MPRYTINIGNDFPLGDDNEPGPGHNSGRDDWGWFRRGMRSGMLLRILFVMAVAAIVLSHPIKTALVVGLVLLVRRSPWFVEFRARLVEFLRGTWPEAARRLDAWRASCGERRGAWHSERHGHGHGHDYGEGRGRGRRGDRFRDEGVRRGDAGRGDESGEERRGYRGFV